MALSKRTYVSGQTIITAENLNEIQDAIIALEGKGLTKEEVVGALEYTPAKASDIPTTDISANTKARHSHSNKDVLDNIAEITSISGGAVTGGANALVTKEVLDATSQLIMDEIPSELKNPYALTFTGASSGTYDGSSAVTINIPSGGTGADGITPHIGDNGNWYIGSTDTGKPSKGEQGPGAEVFYIDLAGSYPNYTCPVAMADIKAAYEAGKVLECRFAMGQYTAVLPLSIPVPNTNTWIFTGSGSLTDLDIPAQLMIIMIYNGGVAQANVLLATKDDIPTSLKNPNALTIKIGSTNITYDGSSAQTVEIEDGTEVSY